ncbi:MAG TPA: hypothetical protein VI685_00255 [Candidatus Angelobacter sp.]
MAARINERHITPVDFLISAEAVKVPSERRYGFTVLAIDCLLVETLGAFMEGLEDTEGKSKKTFCGFLRTRPQFATEFTNDHLAEGFYKQFRCGPEAKVRSGQLVPSCMLTVNRLL